MKVNGEEGIHITRGRLKMPLSAYSARPCERRHSSTSETLSFSFDLQTMFLSKTIIWLQHRESCYPWGADTGISQLEATIYAPRYLSGSPRNFPATCYSHQTTSPVHLEP